MAKTRELKSRIRATEKTRQITKTMEMVSTSKLKRTSDRVRAARPYAQRLTEVIGKLLDPELRENYPLLRQPKQIRRAAVLMLSSNRGLAGGFNINIIRETRTLLAKLRGEGAEVELHLTGRKGTSYFKFRRENIASSRTDISDYPSVDDATALVQPLVDKFINGELDAVYVVYAQFKSALSTPPAVMQVLPVEAPAEDKANEKSTTAGEHHWVANYILSPSADELLNRILPLYVRNSVYRALVETAAAEQGARRTAMKNATDNAGELLDHLRLTYNRARQSQITQEIAEIVGGAAALE
jgi:F-type H+-transporting ATPase subunit gamma